MGDEDHLQRIYQWIDEIPLSRPKRNISRDFADGVLVAEVVAHYYPRMVELHNYPAANSFAQKLYNWQTLGKKVFKKISMTLSKVEMEALCNSEPGSVEQLLKRLQVHLAKYNLRKKQQVAAGGEGSSGGQEGEYDEADGNGSNDEPPMELQPVAHMDQMMMTAQLGPGMSTQQQTAAALAAGADPRLVLQERDLTIDELSETVEILEIKVKKLEQLIRLKDTKIQTMGLRLSQYEGAASQNPAAYS